MVAVKLAAVDPMGEDATEQFGRLELQSKDSIGQLQGNCEAVIRIKPIKYPSPLEQIQTTINIATEKQKYHEYELDTAQITVPGQYNL